MKRRARALSILLIACLMMGCMTFSSFAAGSGKYLKVRTVQDYAKAQKVLKLINKERTKRGLGKLKLDKDLCNAAVTRAAEISVYVPDSSPHKRPNGKLTKTVNSRIMYECCAEGYTTPKEVVKGWMGSPSHRAGILLKNAKSIGIGCATTDGEYDLWTLEFSSSGCKKKVTRKNTVSSVKKVYVLNKYLKKSYLLLALGQSDFDYGYGDPETYVGSTIKLKPYYMSKWNFNTRALLASSDFKWKSGNTSVATVNSKGIVTGKKEGRVKITATMKRSPRYKITAYVDVYSGDESEYYDDYAW